LTKDEPFKALELTLWAYFLKFPGIQVFRAGLPREGTEVFSPYAAPAVPVLEEAVPAEGVLAGVVQEGLEQPTAYLDRSAEPHEG